MQASTMNRRAIDSVESPGREGREGGLGVEKLVALNDTTASKGVEHMGEKRMFLCAIGGACV